MEIMMGADRPADVRIYLAFQESARTECGLPLRPDMRGRGAVTWFYGRGSEQDILVVGLGDKARFNLEMLREAGGNAGREAVKAGAKSVAVSLAGLHDMLPKAARPEEIVTAWVEGWLLGTYVFDKYKTNIKPSGAELEVMQIDCGGQVDYEQAIELGRIRAAGTALARDLCNEAPNDLHPGTFVERIAGIFSDRDVTVRIYRGEELKERQMNGLLAVGGGSAHPPALVEIAYEGDPEAPLLALVGKGITFDMGGMNVKTASDIRDARFDMGGAAAIIGAMDILTRLQVKTRVTALLAIAENVPDASAYLPSHVIRYPNGLSVQVVNTDGEGRLILADALLHASELGAAEVIDIATLTGSVGHALGLKVAGVWGDRDIAELLVRTGEGSGDPIWRMPLVDEDEELLSGTHTDLVNIAPIPYGGANMAALFLRHFVAPEMKWCHIDMANTVQVAANRGYRVTGATGYGVRLLADFVCFKINGMKGGQAK